MIETERPLLREYTMDDFDALYEIMSDPKNQISYAYAITREELEKMIDLSSSF